MILFTSGVGFFEHDGEVHGNAQAELKFNVRDMNDLLLSLVVEDLGGGKVSTIGYPSKIPLAQALKAFPIDLSSKPTLAQLLEQLRGEQVEVDSPSRVLGTIVGVETRKKKVDTNEVIQTDVLNLLTESGLRAIPLDTVSRIKLVNERLDAEFRKALAVLAAGHAADQKTVVLHFLGKGQRPVRIGYIQEMPLWQTSYRLVLDEKKPPQLQGWAIVDNPTEIDWNNVVLTLVSGRPISFTMDLYQPVYVPRPEVHLNLFGSLRPQVYGETLGLAEEAAKRLRDRQAVGQSRGESKADEALEARRGLPPAAAGFGGGWNLRQGVEAAARASAVGELFQYAISTPVSIARQHSALLPIVNAEIKGEKVAIYDESVQADHPLNGFKLRNTTDLFLMQGPITVFDGGSYAGDAMIESIPPHSERLISYAVDLDVEVAPQSKPQPEQIVQVQLIKGVMTVTRKYSRTHDYTIKNSGTKLQTVLVLYPLDPSWNLVKPKKAVEKTRDKYRFAVEAAPGKPTTLAVREERTAGQQIALTNLDENAIQIYLRAHHSAIRPGLLCRKWSSGTRRSTMWSRSGSN